MTDPLQDRDEDETPSRGEMSSVGAIHELSRVEIKGLSEDEWRELVLQRLEHGRVRMDGMEASLAANTAETAKTAASVAQALPMIGHIHEIVETAQSFFRGLAKVSAFFARMWLWLGPVVRAVSVLAGAATAVKVAYITFRGGNPPRSH
ncbi:MAG TPA: hypothetical protein VF453_06490 [Burkholderiaceae bacterium]